MPRKSWLDRAMMKYGGSFLDTDVEEVKTILKIMVIFAILIPYWVIYFQVLILNCLNDAYHLQLCDILSQVDKSHRLSSPWSKLKK